MRRNPRQGQYGRSWLELAIVAAVIGAIAWFWLAGLRDLQATSEKTIVDLTVRNMRTGLQLRTGELMLSNRLNEIPLLAGQNPVQWLAQPPEGYLGELDSRPATPAQRSWYFDRSARTLIYVPATVDSGPMAWRIEAGSSGRNGGMAGVSLVQLPRQTSR